MHRYNKPEGLQAWIEREKLTPTSVAFVDDNSDNAFSMFLFCNGRDSPTVATEARAVSNVRETGLMVLRSHCVAVASLEKQAAAAAAGLSDKDTAGAAPTAALVVSSLWYPPEASSFEENYDAQTRELLLKLSRGRVGESTDLAALKLT